jgi:hypothetical protein
MNPGKAAASAVFHGFDVEVQPCMKEQLWTETLEDEDRKDRENCVN